MGGDDCHTFTSARSVKAFGDYARRMAKLLARFGMVVSDGRKLRRARGLGDYDARGDMGAGRCAASEAAP